MLNKILVAIDQSPISQQAFDTALELAKALGASLTLVHVLDVIDPDAPERPTTLVNSYGVGLDIMLRRKYEHQWDEFVRHYEALLRQKEQQAEAVGVTASYLQPYGHPGQAICEAASVCNADLIIVGSHNRTGLKELVLGSVSSHVMHHAPCSVMVIHPGASHYDVLDKDRVGITSTVPI
ncbi:MAG: universal stress protein [Cyanobacteria bacterium P01_A01_bin.37]